MHQTVGIISTTSYFLGIIYLQFITFGVPYGADSFSTITFIVISALITAGLSIPFFLRNLRVNRFLPLIAIVIYITFTILADPIYLIKKAAWIPLILFAISICLLVYRVVKFRKLYSSDNEGGETDASLKLPGIEALLKKIPKNIDVLKFKKPVLFVGSGIVVLLLVVGAVNLISGLGGGSSQSTSSQSASISVPGYVAAEVANKLSTSVVNIKRLTGNKVVVNIDGSETWDVHVSFVQVEGTKPISWDGNVTVLR